MEIEFYDDYEDDDFEEFYDEKLYCSVCDCETWHEVFNGWSECSVCYHQTDDLPKQDDGDLGVPPF